MGQAKAPFLKNIGFSDLIMRNRNGLHSNTINIKPYPEKVSVTLPPETNIYGGGSRRLVDLYS